MSPSRPDDPFGKRALFRPPPSDGAATNGDGPSPPGPGAGRSGPRRRPGSSAGTPSSAGRRALFSTPEVHGPAVVVECRSCRTRTPLSLIGFARRLIPSLWLPVAPWTRWMRCPSCGAFSWCRIDWSRVTTRG